MTDCVEFDRITEEQDRADKQAAEGVYGFCSICDKPFLWGEKILPLNGEKYHAECLQKFVEDDENIEKVGF